MSFDILASYGVVVPEPTQPLRPSTSNTRRIAPIEKPPVDQDPVPPRKPTNVNVLHLTSNQLAQLSLEEKEVLVQQLRNRKNKIETQINDAPKTVVDHVEDAWCPCCVNEYMTEKEKASRRHQKEMELLQAKQQQDAANRAKDAEKEQARLLKQRNADQLKDFLAAEAERKAAEKANQKAEQAALKKAHEEQMQKYEAAFQDKQKQKQKDAALRQAEIDENKRLKASQKAAELEADKKLNPFMPTGMDQSPETRQKKLEEMLRAFDEDQAAKRKMKDSERLENQKMREEALRALEQARADGEKKRQQKADEQRLAAEAYQQEVADKAAAKLREKDAEKEIARIGAAKVAELDAKEKAENRARQEQNRDYLNNAFQDGKRQDELNKELEKLLGKVNQMQSAQKPPVHKCECDRCEDPNDPAMMTIMTKEELADAAQYIDLKKHKQQ